MFFGAELVLARGVAESHKVAFGLFVLCGAYVASSRHCQVGHICFCAEGAEAVAWYDSAEFAVGATGYFLRMNPKNQLVAWDMWPRGEQGRYQWQIKGDVPYQIETARKLPKAEEYRVHIIKEKDICVVYINDEIVLSTRMYNHKDGYAGIYVVQGDVKLIQYKEKRSE